MGYKELVKSGADVTDIQQYLVDGYDQLREIGGKKIIDHFGDHFGRF